MNKTNFNIFVGGTSGIFKGIQVGKKGQIVKNIQDLASITKNDRITTIEWSNGDEQDILIACGLKENRRVKVYDSDHLVFTRTFSCNIGEGSIKGLSRCDGSILTAVESGEVNLWPTNTIEVPIINAGHNLEKMRHSRMEKNIIITAGLENRLKVFDLEKQRLIFIEKDLPHDKLQLRVPIWITDLNFLSRTQEITTVSKYGYIRLYDTRAQRRPVINIKTPESWISLSVTSKDKHIIVGSTKGTMNLIDLRKLGILLNTYKGFTGAITGITCSMNSPYIASVSLDRHLRIHHMDTKMLLKKIYLTSHLTCMVMKSDFSL